MQNRHSVARTLVVDIAAAVGQEQIHDVRVAWLSSVHQWAQAIRASGGICATCQEEGRHLVVALSACSFKGTSAASGPEVDVGPLVQQVPDHLHPAKVRSRCERRGPAVAKGIQQSPVLLHKAPHLLQVAPVGRLGDGLEVRLLHVFHRGLRKAAVQDIMSIMMISAA
jgi:hypothetical protein